MMNNALARISALYGDGWTRGAHVETTRNHFDPTSQTAGFPLGQKGVGIEAGCGDGLDTVRLARTNPDALIYAMDLSEGANVAARRLRDDGIENVRVLRTDLAHIPLPDVSVDWCYSYGVIHHMRQPEDGMREIGRLMKPGGRIATYLYTDHRESSLLKRALFFLFDDLPRPVTSRLPLPVLGVCCWLASWFWFYAWNRPMRALGIIGPPYTHEDSRRQVYGGFTTDTAQSMRGDTTPKASLSYTRPEASRWRASLAIRRGAAG